MGKKIFFQDGSAIEISTEILKSGEMATAAYRKVLEFIEDEITDLEAPGNEASELDDPEIDEFDDDLELDLDEEDDIDSDEDDDSDDDDLDVDDEWDEEDDDLDSKW